MGAPVLAPFVWSKLKDGKMKNAARVRYNGGMSWNARGYQFKRGQTIVVSNPADVQYFKGQPGFTVTSFMKDLTPAKVAKTAPPTHAPVDEDDESSDDEGEDDGEQESELPAWNPGMKKAELLKAAEARNLAVTPQDTNATIVQMLREFETSR